MDTIKTIKELMHLYKKTEQISTGIDLILGGYPMKLDEVSSGIRELMQKIVGMPSQEMKLTSDITEDDHIFCSDYYGDLLFDYAREESELTENEIISEFLNWDWYLSNYKICEEGNLYCSCGKKLITRWGDGNHIFGICKECNEGQIAKLTLSK